MANVLKNIAALKSSKITLVVLALLAFIATLYTYNDPTDYITDGLPSRMLGPRRRARRDAYLKQRRRELIWVMSHPLAGSDDIINMVERATLTSMGTNYGNIVQRSDMEKIVNTRESILIQKRWYRSGPFQNNVDLDLPAEYGDVLVKTYCTGHCLTDDGSCSRIPYSRNLVSMDKFWDSCAGGTKYITGRKPGVKRAKPYWRNQVKKVIVVVRNPMNMVMARFIRDYPNDYNGRNSALFFDNYCQAIDDHYMAKNKEVKMALKKNQRIKPLVDGVKCVTEFWRIAMWYKQAFAIAQRIDPLIIHREEYVSDPQRILNAVLNHGGMKQTNSDSLPVFTEDTVAYFNNEETEKIGALFEAVVNSDSDTWESFKHYFVNQVPTMYPSASITAPPSKYNVARGKPTSQSSISWGGVSSRGVDGNTSGIWDRNGITHTPESKNPWWNVDLGDVYKISSITIFNRQDCCSNRLANFKIGIFNLNTEVWSYTYKGTPGYKSNISVTGQAAVLGDSVKVWLEGSRRILSLAEVEVWGVKQV